MTCVFDIGRGSAPGEVAGAALAAACAPPEAIGEIDPATGSTNWGRPCNTTLWLLTV
jgi:hypothetical protein